jgi:DNA-binding transcriptional regulator YhcF (GntR family)
VIEFRLDMRSGVAPYLQLAQQVRHALRLAFLKPGDQLPRVKDVVATLAINPNTVLKAYRELEREGLVEGRPGVGTFVLRGIDGPPPRAHAALQRSLERWLKSARDAGLDHESVRSLFESTFQNEAGRDIA